MIEQLIANLFLIALVGTIVAGFLLLVFLIWLLTSE